MKLVLHLPDFARVVAPGLDEAGRLAGKVAVVAGTTLVNGGGKLDGAPAPVMERKASR